MSISTVAYLNDHMHAVPLLLIPALMKGRMERQNIFYQASLWGSDLAGDLEFHAGLPAHVASAPR